MGKREKWKWCLGIWFAHQVNAVDWTRKKCHINSLRESNEGTITVTTKTLPL